MDKKKFYMETLPSILNGVLVTAGVVALAYFITTKKLHIDIPTHPASRLEAIVEVCEGTNTQVFQNSNGKFCVEYGENENLTLRPYADDCECKTKKAYIALAERDGKQFLVTYSKNQLSATLVK